MALGSALALGALALLAIGGAALLWRSAKSPTPGSDAWFAEQGIIPLISDANRKALDERIRNKNLTSGRFGDVVGYFVPDSAPKTLPRTGTPTPGPDTGERFEIDRLPELPAASEATVPPTPIYMTPDGLISSLGGSVPLSRGER